MTISVSPPGGGRSVEDTGAADGAPAAGAASPQATSPQTTSLQEAVQNFGISIEDYLLPVHGQIQILAEDGTMLPEEQRGSSPGHQYPVPPDEELLEAYRRLVVGRRVNDQNSALVRQGRLAVYPSSHGQEACQVAAALCLQNSDWMFPTYRDAVAVMTRGVDPVEVMTIFRGDWHGGYDPHAHHVGIQSTPLT
ncbi:MAG: pyruvate dehydrogenase (acetyl-transferring) E1 component subunit alpha, partial [Arthrobacter sp.]|nr:pyruvate dehydrogenase (acetyl-transferring) E1 component subunit alpha [Arthrobacter sp.]